MRYPAIALTILLGGCGTNGDLGSGFISSVSAYSAATTAQDNLEIDLMKDFARKSEQLRFISVDTYSCGDPDDSFVQDIETAYKDASKRFKKTKYQVLLDARKELRSKDAILSGLSGYGTLIASIAQDYKNVDAALTKAQSIVDNFKAAELIPEAGAILGGLKSVMTIAQTVEKYSVETAIRAAAQDMRKPLANTVAALSKKETLLSLTGPEARAFSYWDACAQERLTFIRDYYPSILAKAPGAREKLLDSHLLGMRETSVLDFAKEYGVYLSEREGFVGRRPDYLGLLKAISKANEQLITLSANDVLDAANNVSAMTGALAKASDDLRKQGF